MGVVETGLGIGSVVCFIVAFNVWVSAEERMRHRRIWLWGLIGLGVLLFAGAYVIGDLRCQLGDCPLP